MGKDIDPFWQLVHDVIVRTQGRDQTAFRAKYPWSEDLERQAKSLSIEEILDHEYYMGKGKELYPVHKDDIIEIFERKKNGENIELFVSEEGWGAGKNYKFAAILYIMIFQHIILNDFKSMYPTMASDTGISFLCTSRNSTLGKEVAFGKVIPFFLRSPFFLDYFPPDIDLQQVKDFKRKPDRLRFPNDILIYTGTGSALSALSYDLAGGGIDEVNFMEYVESSDKEQALLTEDAKTYDAADVAVRTVLGRMRSRFMREARLSPYSLLMAFSSSGYAGDFTSRKGKESLKDPRIIYKRRSTWSAKPRVWNGTRNYSDKTFDFDLRTMKVASEVEAKEQYEEEFGLPIELKGVEHG